jgi:hypothetical protein
MKKTVDKDIVSSKMIALIDGIKAKFSATAFNEEVLAQMKELREMFKAVQQPTIVKSVRLVYEHLGQYGNLDNIPYWEQEEIELDEQQSSMHYYLDLLYNPINKYNKEEIKEINAMLKEVAEG